MLLSFMTALKACAKKKDLSQGCKIHADIRACGLLEKDPCLGNTLISMYAKCGALVRAQQVFDELPFRSVIAWTALIAGYVQHGQGQEALSCFHRMRSQGFSPDAFTYAIILKACGIMQDADMGSQIHDEIACQGLLKNNAVLGGALVDMYAKCGALLKAQKVFDALSVHNGVSWTALIAGYAQHGQGQEALDCFQRMQSQGFSPNATTYASVLKACGIMQDIDVGNQVHDEIVSQGLLKDNVVLGGALVDMYAKCGVLTKAQKVFDGLPIRNPVCWNALIAGYTQQGQGQEALSCFEQMWSKGFSPDAVTYACVLKACGIMQDVDIGKKIHDEIASQGLLNNNVVLGGAVVDMYAKCGALLKAQKVFDGLPVRNAVSWTALITGYAQHGQGQEALGCFQRMRSQLSPNAVTYACALKACGITQDVEMGNQIHDEIVSQGLLKDSQGLFQNNVLLGGALVDMYAKCGAILKAQKVFDALHVRNAVSWTALIAGYAQHGQGEEALCCFQQMRSEGFSPDAVTYACALKACGIVQDINMGKKIHDEIVRQGLLKNNVVLGGALVDMYAKCGALLKAQKVFDMLPMRSAVAWTALIGGYTQHGQGEEALGCFQQMRSQGFSPNAVTYACVLKACGITQDVDVGNQIHDEIVSQGLLKGSQGLFQNSVLLGGALVDTYAKCGALLKAQKIFDALPVRNAVSWTALIAGYAQHGHAEEALGCFQRMRSDGFSPDAVTWNAIIGGYAQRGLAKEALDFFEWMQKEGISPDAITLLNVLNACSHSGLVDQGETYFDNMRETFGIAPSEGHYTCMVVLFGGARLFDKAMRVIRMMPSLEDYPRVWSALLGACRKWGNVKLGRFAFERAVQIDRYHAGTYVLMSSIYAAAGMQEEAQSIEQLRRKNAARK